MLHRINISCFCIVLQNIAIVVVRFIHAKQHNVIDGPSHSIDTDNRMRIHSIDNDNNALFCLLSILLNELLFIVTT